MKQKINKRKLLKLAKLLEDDARRKKGIKFDLGFWGIVEDKSNPLSCNTTACAMGLAALSGKFKGLEARVSPLAGGMEVVYDKRAFGFEAAAQLFNIPYEVAVWLFGVEYYDIEQGETIDNYTVTEGAIGEKMVAKRIRDYVAGKAKLPNALKTGIAWIERNLSSINENA